MADDGIEAARDGLKGPESPVPDGSEEAAGTKENVLEHLLKIEAQAADLVSGAQAEADRRIAESEKQNRARYDAEYGRQVLALDTAYDETVVRIRAEYRGRLEQYRTSLDAIPVDQGRFSARVDELLALGLSSRGL
jgi:regulator of protease activity HflC (stomatin/prohibitin superfamily)